VYLEDSYARALPGTYVDVEPAGFPDPVFALRNDGLARELGLDPEALTAGMFTGDVLPEGAHPLAMAYAGHQFGGLSPQLGDGRAMLLGEIRTPGGSLVDLHLKGTGRTPFSRGGDGKATLGPMLREYVVGEAMHALGIPTTRALAVVTTGEPVRREGGWLPGAVLARVASSHLRVGTFELFALREDGERLGELVRYALSRHHPEGLEADVPAAALLLHVARVQATLIAQWMLVGFVHGVMNTDNSTISGETIDYGPCAFMDAYDPATVFSSIDRHGRYAFGRQPQIGLWNLTRFAEALFTELGGEDAATATAQAAQQAYADTYDTAFLAGMRRKLGLSGAGDREADLDLVTSLLTAMRDAKLDWTQTFRTLADAHRSPAPALLFPPALKDWVGQWQSRLRAEGRPAADVADAMDAVNPIYIPRNHRVEAALQAAVDGDIAPVRRLVDVLRRPFVVQDGAEADAQPAPDGFGPYITFCGT
jgi:uncharacterized protein YdiU (UPF0061 family)